MGTGFVEYGQKHRFAVVKRLASRSSGVIVELGANHSTGIITDSIKMDVKGNCDMQANLNDGIPLEDDSVDVIIACEIIEHLTSPYAFMKEVRRVLKKDGMLILSMPNLCSLKNRLMVLLGMFPNNAAQADFYRYWMDDNDLPQLAHYSDYTFTVVTHALNKEGFYILEKKTNGIFFGGKRILPLSLTPATLGEHIIIKAGLNGKK